MIGKSHPIVGFHDIGFDQSLKAAKITVNEFFVDLRLPGNFVDPKAGITLIFKYKGNGVDQFPLCLFLISWV